MADNFNKIKKLISDSPLMQEERDDLMLLFFDANDADLEIIISLLTESPNLLKTLSDNYQGKKRAVGKNDSVLWQEVVRKEVEALEQISKKDI